MEVLTRPKAVVALAAVSAADVAVTVMVVLPKAKLTPATVMLLPPLASPKEMAEAGVAAIMFAPSNEAFATTLVIWSRNWAKSAAKAACEPVERPA